MRLMGSARAAAPRVPCLAAFGIGGSSWPVPPASRWGRHAELTELLTECFALRVQLKQAAGLRRTSSTVPSQTRTRRLDQR